MNTRRSYSELSKLESYEDRYEYLKIGDRVGEETFGYDRYLNQALYSSPEWKSFRHKIIVRDNGNDMGVDGYPIGEKVYIHHLNPITKQDILERNPCLFDEENVVCVCKRTHDAIHFGSQELIKKNPVVRSPGDTKLW